MARPPAPPPAADPANVLIIVSGPDRPGITAKLTAIVAEAGLAILDMEQVVIRELLSLSIVLEFPPGEEAGRPVLKELLFAAKEMGLELDFHVLATREPPRRNLQRSVLTLIGHEGLQAAAISRIAAILAERNLNIEKIQRLDEGRVRCLELIVAGKPEDARGLKAALLPVGHEYAVDIALQPDNLFRRVKRLVVLDLDSTLIQAEVIDELGRRAGVAERVAAITAEAMAGRMDFAQSLRARVALLEGLGEEDLRAVAESLPYTPGAEALIGTLKRLGYRLAIISGGFDYFSSRVRERLGLDYAFANRLEIVAGRLTGRVLEPIIDGQRKAAILEEIAAKEQLQLDQVIAVGDGANDLPMLSRAGLGIAFNAKPQVRDAAEHSLNQDRLDTILFFLGITQTDIAGLGNG